ncbi:MAG: glycosyltransferase family 2 protein [Bacteroidetes bacterium]|nr:glycosyltransferase family 2 protein [Bacteroidota bacterium]
MSLTLTIAICTYNREELLTHCLDSLIPQLTADAELLVIDNGTKKVKTLIESYPEARYVSEDNTGLSFARNKAIAEAQGKWVMYLDDDAKSHKNLVAKALQHCKSNHLVFGGVYYPWYHYGQPKWHKVQYGSNSHNFEQAGILPKNEYLSGGIMCIHKDIFEQVGPFNTALGMTGTSIGYGEESELQDRMIKSNIARVYDDQLIIYHVVAAYKLNVQWFMNASKSRGVDMAKYQTGNKILNIAKQIIIGSAVFIKDLVRYTPQLVYKNYYIQNWKIDVLRKVYKRFGFVAQSINPKN